MTEMREHKPYSSSDKIIHLWAVGAIADYMMYAMFALIPIFFVTSFGMNPVTVSWALFLPRIFDGIADPIIGHISDNTHTRWGRRRPFIFGSAIVGSFLITGMWWMNPDWSPNMQFAFVLVMATLIFLCWGTYNMNHLALGYELSDDYHQRTKVIAVRGAYFSVAAMSGGWFYWITERKVFGGEIRGMRLLSIAIAAVALVSALVAVTFSKERFQKANRKHVNIWRAIWETLHVKPFAVLLMLRIILALGAGLYGAVSFYITVYSVCNNDKSQANSLSGIIGIIGFVMSLLMVPLAIRLSRFVGKRRGLILSCAMGFLGACVLPFFARPGSPYLLLTYMIIFNAILATLLGVFQGAVMPDICDIDELKSGERREGLFSAVSSFISKMENSLCALWGGYVVSFSGFDAHKAKDAIQQTPEVLQRLRWLGFTPNIFFAGLAFLAVWLYPVTEKYMAGVRAQLDERRRSGQAQEGPESEIMPG